jgi:hypothetical protein
MERLTLCANNNSNAIQFELNSKVSLKVKRVLHTGKTYFNFYIENFVNLPENCTGFLGMYNLCLQTDANISDIYSLSVLYCIVSGIIPILSTSSENEKNNVTV